MKPNGFLEPIGLWKAELGEVLVGHELQVGARVGC
jgi:hypothetical protein